MGWRQTKKLIFLSASCAAAGKKTFYGAVHGTFTLLGSFIKLP
jgi:hypothetical protein